MNRKSVLILKNISHEGPGIIKHVLKQHCLTFDVLDLSLDPTIPRLNEYSLLIIMGGPDSANDVSEKIKNELKTIKGTLDHDIPVFGICLGMQLLVKALGGRVIKNIVNEKGFKINSEWNRINLTSLGAIEPIFKGVGNTFEVFHLHGETIEPIENVQHLGENNYCKHQIIKFELNNYGFQFHFELTEEMFLHWLEKAPELTDCDKTALITDFKMLKDDFIRRGRLIFSNYLKHLKLI